MEGKDEGKRGREESNIKKICNLDRKQSRLILRRLFGELSHGSSCSASSALKGSNLPYVFDLRRSRIYLDMDI